MSVDDQVLVTAGLHPEPAVEAARVPSIERRRAPAIESPRVGPPHARTRGNSGRIRELVDLLESHALFIAAVAAVLMVSFASIPAHLSQDGWLALVAGRIVAHQGIPHRDYLTVMAHGVQWHDQQWLAQLVMYELQQLGGFQLLSVVYVLLTGAAFAMAIAAARALGAADRHVTAMLPLGAFFYLATAVSIRTQGFAYPLLVGTVWLLAREIRRPSRRAYLVLPMLVLWANLHGSATLGAAIAFVYGVCLLVTGWRGERWQAITRLRTLTFLASPLCLLITPYGLSIVAYYRATLFNPEFGKLISEWQPVTGYMILAVPLLLLIVGTVWALGRSGRRTPAFNQIVLVMLGLAAVDAVRNITWFGLAVVILLPATLTGILTAKPSAPRRRKLNVTIAAAAVFLTALLAISTLARPASWFESTYPTRAVATVRSLVASRPDAKIYADVRYADWLVWHDPQLAGRIAYDTSFENLSTRQLQSIVTLGAEPLPGKRSPLAPYAVLVLNPKNKATNRIVLWQTHAHVVLRSKRVLIATKSSS